MAITGGFGVTFDLENGSMRRWVLGRDGVKRWLDTDEPVEHMPRALPLPVRCALEWFATSGERTRERLMGLVEHYLTTYGLQQAPERAQWEAQAWAFARNRYGLV